MRNMKWRNWIVPGILVVALLGTGYWGYTEYKVRQDLQNRAESQYQRAFYELTQHLDTITGQLAQLQVIASKEQRILGLATMWRQIFAAQDNLGGLPLALVPLSKTEKFLSDAGDVSYTLLSRTTKQKEILEEKDAKVLGQLYQRAEALKEEMAKLGAKILNEELSWTQVEVALKEANGNLEDNTIINGFKLAEKRMEEYPEMETGDDFALVKPEVKIVRGEEKIDKAEAVQIADKWWNPKEEKEAINLTYEGVGDIPTYGMEIIPAKKEESPVYLDVSKLDGKVIWAMKPKDVAASNVDLSQGEQNCQEFLAGHNLYNMEPIHIENEDNTAIYTFVPRQGNVLLYPDQVKVAVALDNGEIIGFEGTAYYMYHRTRDLPLPKISENTLKNQLNPRLKVELIRPALIANDWGKEVLTWEVRGSYDKEKFALFYNAESGSEEMIVRLTPPPKFDFLLEE